METEVQTPESDSLLDLPPMGPVVPIPPPQIAPAEAPVPGKVNGKKPHHAFGNPNAPLWKDVVTDFSNHGALSKAQWESSVLWLIKPFAIRNNWTGRDLVQRAVRAIRRMTDRYPKIGEILAVWDAMPVQKRNRVMSLDRAIEQVDGISKDELAGLILAGMKNEAFATAKAIQAAALPDMMAASMDAVSGSGPSASSERVRHLETMGVIKQNKGQQIVVNANSSANAGDAVKSKSFDDQLAELDEAIDADYEMLPGSQQPKQLSE